MDRTGELYEIFRHSGAVTTDSRTVSHGSLFFALRGENFDGNDYAAAAIEAGAAVAVVDNPAAVPVIGADKYFLVDDVLAALQQLAALHRCKLGIPVLAITGSNGKTTTKELIGRILSKKYRVAVTQGNLNNHIGVPLTILAMDDKAAFGVVEMGASHCGEIALLCRIAQPDYGIITNIGKAHIEGFGGIEGVARGKGELFDYLAASGGTAFYLKENAALSGMAAERVNLEVASYTVGELAVTDNVENSGFLNISWKDGILKTHLVGDYNLYNIAAAIAVGEYFGVAAEQIVAAVESYIPDNNRSQRLETAHNLLILDAYNANPTSMEKALENFAVAGTGRPKAVILGDMLELGEYAGYEHMQVITLLHNLGFAEIYLVGRNFTDAATRLGVVGSQTRVFADTGQFITWLEENPIVSRAILIKGSRGNRLEKITEFL